MKTIINLILDAIAVAFIGMGLFGLMVLFVPLFIVLKITNIEIFILLAIAIFTVWRVGRWIE